MPRRTFELSRIPCRINVVGSSGTGKSTFSKRLAHVLEIPHIEMDAIFWAPDWTMRSDEEFFPLLEKALSSEHWVLDGNYSKTTHIKWMNVQSVVWLDYSFPRTLYQSLRRAMARAITRQELWPETGNRESFRRSFFSKDSIILWSITNYSKVRRQYLALFAEEKYAHIVFIRLTSFAESDVFLDTLSFKMRPSDRKPVRSEPLRT